jgi:uncharacterized membrane protein
VSRFTLAGCLVAGSFLWPALLGAAAFDRSSASPSAFSTVIYMATARICHQHPERSFAMRGVPWPVCGRCLGLYLSAPAGALAAWLGRRRKPRLSPRVFLAIASLPTVLTLAIEWSAVSPLSNMIRWAAALPLGAAIAAILIREAVRVPRTDQLH